MVTIKKGQKVPETNFVVFSDSGEYDESDLILCGEKGAKEPVAQYEARYVASGAEVYQGGNDNGAD